MTTGVRRAETEAEREDALAVRYEIFVEEQGVPEELEADGRDDEAIHFVGYAKGDSGESDSDEADSDEIGSDETDHDGTDYDETDSDEAERDEPDSDASRPKPVAAGRLRPVGDGVDKVERIAVLESYRGEGWGRKIMAELEATAEERGIEKLVVHAQTPVEEFYRKLDYETTSDVFEEAGIEHVEMEKSLA